MSVKYWGYFAGKVLLAAAIAAGAFWAMHRYWPVQQYWLPVYKPLVGYRLVEYTYVPKFGTDLAFTTAVGLWFLFTCGLLYLAVWDQRYRCRVCLRRLRMPIQTGSWSSMLQRGRPRIEYICAYGHGTLNVEQLQIGGVENPEWTPQQEDLWEELYAGLSRSDEKR
ncbi:MAG: hypothetical protein IT158_20820 [Bryobacterales bacterium]|nr:hypothetical protein [Bryobacterales bacterium]